MKFIYYFLLIFFIFTTKNSHGFNYLMNCGSNESLACTKGSDGKTCSGVGYIYDSNSKTRIMCKDTDLPYFGSQVTNAINTISSIPIIGQVINIAEMVMPFVFAGRVVELSANTVSKSDLDALMGAITFLTNFLSIFETTNVDAAGFLAFSQVYNTNQYCQVQAFYKEETKYITRQEASSVGGYPVYPIYPQNISIVNNQCNYYDTINKTFLLPSHDSSLWKVTFLTDTNSTKCSYSYSPTRAHCLNLDIPIFSTYSSASIAAESNCIVCNPKNTAKAQQKIAQAQTKLQKFKAVMDIVAKVGSEIISLGTEVASMFVDPKMVYDPISLKYVLDFEYAFSLVFGFMDYLSQPWPAAISCFSSRYAVLTATKTALLGVGGNDIKSNYEKAKKGLQHIRFCGQDWFSYEKTRDGKYYVKGPYTNSRFKAVNDCINTSTDPNYNNECDKITDVVCSEDSDKTFCNGITKTSKDIRNKIYREFLYSGREYESKIVEKNISLDVNDNRNRAITYDIDYCIDPRLPRVKGYYSLMQRYYMKGNDKANFACSRFFYDGKNGCVLPKKDIDSVITTLKNDIANGIIPNNDERVSVVNNIENIFISYDGIIKDDNENTFYIVDKNQNEIIFNIFNEKCSNAFLEARQCCKYRSQHMFCLESIKGTETNITGGKALTDISVVNNSFCFSNVINSYSTSETLKTTLVDYIKSLDTDLGKITCSINDESGETYYFEGTKKTNTNYVCVFSDALCPYDFKLNVGLNYRASYCDSNNFLDSDDFDASADFKRESTHLNAASCKEGLFSVNMREKYKDLYSSRATAAFIFDMVKKDIGNFNDNDFKTIYDFSKLTDEDLDKYYGGSNNRTNLSDAGFYTISSFDDEVELVYPLVLNDETINKIKTSAYGQTKNFCQYRAHCVEVEKEEVRDTSDIITSTFLDSSCNSSSTNSRNIQRSSDATILRQLSVPVVECVYESLNNLINGISGMSSCKNSELNSYGYCGSDTEEIVKENLKNGNMAFFESKYNSIVNADGSVSYIIKGERLPEKFNPFLKIQNNFKDIIKIALTIFLVLFAYSALFSGKMDSIVKGESGNALMLFIFKFSIVSFLIFNNGWQKGIYNYILNFATAGYDFVNSLFIGVINSPKNQVLNLNSNAVIKLVEEDNITKEEKNVYLCYKYNLYNNAEYKIRNIEDGGCGSGGFKSKTNSPEIYIKTNKNFPEQLENNLIISKNQEIQQLLYVIDKYNDTNYGSKIKIKYKTGSSWGDSLANSAAWNSEYDGCYFDTSEYKTGKTYLAFFDTIDCKITRYLGYSVQNIAPNLVLYSVLFLVPQYFFPNVPGFNKIVSTVGSVLSGLILAFIFIMFNFVIKAAYTFVSSFFILSILIFISPIILPLMFFNKTKSIFDSWFKEIVGLIFKPMFNIAFLTLYINIMDILLMDGITFTKHSEYGRDPNVICDQNSFSFFCLVNRNIFEMFETLLKLFDGYITTFLFNVLIAFLFFKLADTFLSELESLVSKIFSDMMTGSSKMTGIGGANGALDTYGTLNKAMDSGKKLEEFRSAYVQGSAYALGSTVDNIAKGAVNTYYDNMSRTYNKARTDYENDKLAQLGFLTKKGSLINDNLEIDKKIRQKNKELLSASKEDQTRLLSEINSLKENKEQNNNTIMELDTNISEMSKKIEKDKKDLSKIDAERLKALSVVDSISIKNGLNILGDKISDSYVANGIRKGLLTLSEYTAGHYSLLGQTMSKIKLVADRVSITFNYPSEKESLSKIETLSKKISRLENEINSLEESKYGLLNKTKLDAIEAMIDKKKNEIVDAYFDMKELKSDLKKIKTIKDIIQNESYEEIQKAPKKSKIEEAAEERKKQEETDRKIKEREKELEELDGAESKNS